MMGCILGLYKEIPLTATEIMERRNSYWDENRPIKATPSEEYAEAVRANKSLDFGIKERFNADVLEMLKEKGV